MNFVQKLLLHMLFGLLTWSAVSAQSISGTSCLPKASSIYYTYSLNYPGSSYSWSVVGGADFSGHTSGTCSSSSCYVNIIWTSTATSGYITIPGATLNVTMYTPLVPGSISAPFPTIAFNAIPPTYTCPAATGGYCSPTYAYQWQSSLDGTNFSDISGATGLNLSFSTGLVQSTYYRRRVTVGTIGTVAYSNVGQVTISSPLVPGSVAPATQTINYNTVPAALSLSGTFGAITPYTYQWQSSPDNTAWTNVSGATATTYSPPALTAMTYYRVGVTSNGGTLYTSSVVVQVYPLLPVVPGSVSPASQTVNFNTAPGVLTSTGVSGGNNVYTYQWQSAPDNASWTNISGATAATYTPPALKTKTWYRVAVTSSALVAYSSSAYVDVYPQLLPGSIAPVNIVITSGASPGGLGGTPASGGGCSGSYSYQWLSSVNGASFTAVSGATSAAYAPPALTANTWYARQVSCNGVVAISDTIQVVISSATPDMNYIRTFELSKPGVVDDAGVQALTSPNDVSQLTQYYDGLGRLVQTVDKQQSPLLKDEVELTAYDAFGREMYKYLPYVASAGNGNYKPTALSDQYAFNALQYPGEQNYFGVESFELSPLDRANTTYAPGLSWSGSGRGTVVQRQVNTLADSVAIWNIAYTAGSLPVMAGRYPAGTLYKTVTIDEAMHADVEYKDFDGRVILKKVQLAATPGSAHAGWLCTYYVYDNLGNMRYTIQPRATELINNTSGNWTVTQAIADELCFRYEYDARNRLITKKVSGAGEIWMVYDVRDRLVLTQDAVLRGLHKWLFTLYDPYNRADSTGFITDAANYNSLSYHVGQAAASASYPNIGSYPNEVLTGIYYDDYTWTATFGSTPALGAALVGQMDAAYTTFPYPQAVTPYRIARGKTTGIMNKVLGTGTFLYTANYYDDDGRLIQKQNGNYTGGIDTLTTQYTFTGHPLRTIANHQKAGNTVQHHDVATKMTYDAGLRLKSVWKNVDNGGYRLIDSLQYDELGLLRVKYLGNGIDSMVYDHNIRGWLTGINRQYVGGGNNHFFGLELNYDKTASAVAGSNYTTAQYDGSLAGMTWKTRGDSTKRKYDFTYDNVSRLTGAGFLQNTGSGWSSSLVNYTVSNLSYDANGNIMTMDQQGFKWNGSALVDQLTYTYLAASNKLRLVNDAANDSLSQLGDFHYKGTKGAEDYRYDANGNMTIDNNKVIDTIMYNHLGLPQKVHVKGKGNVLYTYDAAGNKLSKQVVDSMSRRTTTTLYIDGLVYQHIDTITAVTPGVDTLQFLAHEEGRIRWALHYYQNGTKGYGWETDFFEKDHLGNTRMVLTTQHDTSTYMATMEGAYRSKENALFYNIQQSAYSRVLAGYPVDLSTTNPNDSVIALNGMPGKTQGPAIILKVMAGDTVKVGAKCYYTSQASGARNTALNDLLASLATGVVGLTGGGKGTVTQLNTPGSGPLYGALNNFVTNKEDSIVSKPRAYLNYMFLDDQYQYDATKSGALAVGNYAAATLDALAASVVTGKNGYLYVWVSNETQGWPVYFDNLSVQVFTGPLVEETHYYPFGLTMAGISDKALKGSYVENKYKFNKGSELQNKEFSDGSGLEWYDAHARFYDPQLGRFMQVDPRPDDGDQEEWTVYQYGMDNPGSYNDPNGDCPLCALVGAVVGGVVGAAIEVGSQLYHSGKVTNWKAVGGSAAQGAITGGVAGLTGGASLVVSVGANAGANIVGGVVNRAIQGKGTTVKDVVVDGLVGGGVAGLGKVAGKYVEKGLNKLSNQAKGKLGETVTRIKYLAKGYKDEGNAVVATGRKTATGRTQVAKYDHAMENMFTGKKLTVESKFNKAGYTDNQIAAASKVTTPGGVIESRTTSEQLGRVAEKVIVTGGTPSSVLINKKKD